MLDAVLSSFELDAWSFVAAVLIILCCSSLLGFRRKSCNRPAAGGIPLACRTGLLLATCRYLPDCYRVEQGAQYFVHWNRVRQN